MTEEARSNILLLKKIQGRNFATNAQTPPTREEFADLTNAVCSLERRFNKAGNNEGVTIEEAIDYLRNTEDFTHMRTYAAIVIDAYLELAGQVK